MLRRLTLDWFKVVICYGFFGDTEFVTQNNQTVRRMARAVFQQKTEARS
jgi:hypothetical protein